MMVVHIDPDNSSVYMVSIPRDSWVYMSLNGGMHKIDQAFFFGATQHNSFDDGVRAARQTIEQDYGITIDRYAWVGLSGFASVIDTLGGVDIDVTHPIVDDAYPDDTRANPNDPFAVKRLYLVPGPQHLNGLEALEYVRSRHADLVGDIGRMNRQQEILQALKKKLTVPNIIDHFQQLITDLAGKVYTDMSPQEVLAFANFGRTLPSSGIQHVTLGPGSGNQNYGQLAQVNDPSANADQDVVLPQCNNIGPLFANIFGGLVNCNVTGGF
jgi:LCP family protein required for cell wall assembly